jgi:hypothetical protein
MKPKLLSLALLGIFAAAGCGDDDDAPKGDAGEHGDHGDHGHDGDASTEDAG